VLKQLRGINRKKNRALNSPKKPFAWGKNTKEGDETAQRKGEND